MRFFRVAVALQDSSGIVRHRCVPAAFRDDRTAIAAIRHIGVEVHVVQEGGQVHRPVKHLDLGLCRAVEETGRVQSLRVEIREDGIDQLLQVAVLVRIGHRVDGKEYMELGPRRFAILALQVVARVMDGKGHIRKRLRDIGRINPVFRILRMVVVAVYRQAVAVANLPDDIVDIIACRDRADDQRGRFGFVNVLRVREGNAKLEKLKGQTKEEYSLMRKIANILLRDIMLGRETRVVREFREYLTVEQMEQIKAQFSDRVSQPDDDINISTDQKERLIKAIEGGLRYPKISYTGFIDYKETLAFLEQLHDVFDWETYEKDTLGSKNRLKKYVVLLEKWIKGESLKQIIDEDVDYRWTKKRMVYLPNSKEVFNGSPAHINQVISDNLNMINDVLLFRLANYFLRFSNEYRAFHNLKSLGFNDWYEFVEYGTWEYFPINLQKNGFSREVASYINRYRGNYTVEIDGRTLLKRSLFRCANASVSREAKEVAYNMPELFEEE